MIWYALFSQTGSEIKRLSEKLGRWPDRIFTNNFIYEKWSDNLSADRVNVINSEYLYSFLRSFNNNENYIITLHGWMRVVPDDLCQFYNMYNGHPGLANHYPELKGKDPQEKVLANMSKYKIIGSIVHKVTPDLDGGEVVSEIITENTCNNKEDLYNILRSTSLASWYDFLKGKFNE